MENRIKTQDISQEKFQFINSADMHHDQKLDTKPVGYFKDAFRRFCKNKASVAAAIIILFLLLFSFLAPLVSPFKVTFNDPYLNFRLPKSKAFSWLGWDGCKKETGMNGSIYWEYLAVEKETGMQVVRKTYGDGYIIETQQGTLVTKRLFYDAYIDSYTSGAMKFLQLTAAEYEALQNYQDENNIQIIYPIVPERDDMYKYEANLWYKFVDTGRLARYPIGFDVEHPENTVLENNYIAYSGQDNYKSKMRIEGEEKLYDYALRKQGNSYWVRLNYNEYFKFKNGSEPVFLFGTDQYGMDIFIRLASGARFSLLFALAISLINLTIGAIYGAIEGYYGGAADMVMERISDILAGVPFMVVVTLFKLHIADKVGTIVTLLFAFVLTGWIGMAGTVRMQFYRYKNQEYVLAARTLGARDGRIMFKHIFPNALGTIVTSCVLVIPSVIFSESSLSYLGIINLSTGNTTSVGTLLANGQPYLRTAPHIILFPALFISLLMISFNLFGNGLRDAFNPSLRGVEG